MSFDNILVIASNKYLLEQLLALLKSEGFAQVEYATSTSAARKKVGMLDPSLIIINSPIYGELRTDLILDLSENTTSNMIILAKNEFFLDMQVELQHIGAIIISKPLNRSTFIDTLHFVTECRQSIRTPSSTHLIPSSKEEEKILITQSKQLLINNLNLSEPCAHRYIQKQSMNLRISQVKVAQQIIHYFLNEVSK